MVSKLESSFNSLNLSNQISIEPENWASDIKYIAKLNWNEEKELWDRYKEGNEDGVFYRVGFDRERNDVCLISTANLPEGKFKSSF